MSVPAAAATAMTNETRTVVVLGVSYGGYHAAQMIASGLPKGWRVIAVDRNSHVNHLYVFPRFAVLGGHEHKAFIPYTHVFAPKQPDQDQDQPTLDSESAEKRRHLFLQARATALTPHSLTLDRAFPEHGFPTGTIAFDYLVYALGAQLPDPINLWAEGNTVFGGAGERGGKRAGDVNLNVLVPGSKASGIAWLRRHQEVVKDASSVLVVGGGALGIQYATDIAELYPNKQVTLMHSRHRLMPRFDEEMHEEVLQSLQSLGVNVILGSRLGLSSLEASATTKRNECGQRVVRTADGREVAADLVLLCTGQKPNTNLLAKMDARTVDAKTGLARVLRTMQLAMVGDGVSPHDNSGEAEPADGGDTARTVAATAAVAESGGEEKRSIAVDKLNKLTAPCNDTCYPHIFAIGDAADAFGALKAGHTAYFQGHIAAANLLKLIKQGKEEEEEEATSTQQQVHEQEQEHEQLEQYQPGPPSIKVSLGLNKAVYQVNGVVGVKSDCKDDLEAGYMWKVYGFAEATEEEMLSL